METGRLAVDSVATSKRYVVVAALCLVATIAYMGRNCLGVASDAVAGEFDISLPAMGWVLSAFFWGYAVAQIPSGWLCHRWGVRVALTTYALVWSLACAAIGLATGFWSLIAFQLLFGIAQAGVFPCAAAAISRWIPVSRRAVSSGLMASFMSIGGAMGATLTGLALDGFTWNSAAFGPIDWRWIFVLFALPGIVWAIWFFSWYRNNPAEHAGVNEGELSLIQGEAEAAGENSGAPRGAVPWKLVFSRFDMWMIFSQQFFRAAGYIFFATWFPEFLRETRGVSMAASGYLTAMPLLGVVAGGTLGGLLVDFVWNRTHSRRLSRQAIAVSAMLASATFIGAAYFVAAPGPAVSLITAGAFSAALSGCCGYTVTIEKAGRHVAPVFGAMNMSGNLGAALCPVFVSWMVDWWDRWEPALILFAVIYVLAAACWALLNPNSTLEDRRAVEETTGE